jgi:dienelactone hydrolase
MQPSAIAFPLFVVAMACSSSSTTPASPRDAASDTAAHEDASQHHDASMLVDSDSGKPVDAASPYGKYAADGPATVTMASLSVTITGGESFTVMAYLPSTTGARPVVVLSSGFVQPALAYAPYAERLASWGIVTLLRNSPGLNESADGLASDVSYLVTTWLPAENSDAKSTLFGRVDVANVGLAGHSEGGQASLLAAEGGLHGKVKGVFGLDPVDTSVDGSVTARASIGTIGVPLAFIGETTDSSGGVAGMPCAPAADNYEVLFGDAMTPAVAITAVGADHTMFEDPSHCTFCTLCTAGTADASAVLSLSVRYLTAFFARELLGDATVGATFEGAGVSEDESSGRITLQSK